MCVTSYNRKLREAAVSGERPRENPSRKTQNDSRRRGEFDMWESVCACLNEQIKEK